MVFAVDYSTGFDRVGQGAGDFAEKFTETINKKALVDAEVARTEALLERNKAAMLADKMRDRSAQQIAAFNVEWQGPDKGFVAQKPGEQSQFMGADAAGRPSPLDAVKRRKMRAMQEIAQNLPAEMLPEFLSMRTRELEEEIVQQQRETMQGQLADLAGRLAKTPYGEIYQGEIETALQMLDDPGSDPNRAEQVYNKLQGIVEQSVVEQMQFDKAEATVGGMIEEVGAQGGNVEPYAAIYGKLMSGALTPEEARGEAIRKRFDLGPETMTLPGGKKFEINSKLLQGRGRNIDELDQASAADAWLAGAEMAKDDPSLGDLATPEQVQEAIERYAMMFIRKGGWSVPPGYAKRPWEGQHARNDPANILRIRKAVESGEIKTRAALDAMFEALNVDPQLLSQAQGAKAAAEAPAAPKANNKIPASAALEGGESKGTPPPFSREGIAAKQAAAGEKQRAEAQQKVQEEQARNQEMELLRATSKVLSPLGYKGQAMDRKAQIEWVERQIMIEFAKGANADSARVNALQDVLDTLDPQPPAGAAPAKGPGDKPQPEKARKPRHKAKKG